MALEYCVKSKTACSYDAPFDVNNISGTCLFACNVLLQFTMLLISVTYQTNTRNLYYDYILFTIITGRPLLFDIEALQIYTCADRVYVINCH